jgi:DNA modification methylase
LDRLIEIFVEVKRVTKGAIWVNIGDTYAGGGGGTRNENRINKNRAQDIPPRGGSDILEKSLCGIPERFAIRMTDDLGLIRRNTIIWHKPNCMPSSARDRFTVDFEYVYFFTKSPRYYFETQYEPYNGKDIKDYGVQNPSDVKRRILFGGNKHAGYGPKTYSGKIWNPSTMGRIKRAVWHISTKPFAGAHFAVFPQQLITPMILSGCPKQICNKCGFISKRNYDESRIATRPGLTIRDDVKSRIDNDPNADFHKSDWSKYRFRPMRIPTDLTSCGCNVGFTSGIVLDPFSGAGTTALTARSLNRHFLGIELNADYVNMSNARLGTPITSY